MKYTEMDVEKFLNTFVPAKRLTRSQLKTLGDFSGLDLDYSKVKESAMYPVIVRLPHTILRRDILLKHLLVPYFERYFAVG